MRVAIIGANGQLGRDLVKVFSSDKDFEILPLTHCDIEINQEGSVLPIMKNLSPRIIINTAAFHNTKECEYNPQQAFLVNSIGVKNLVKVANLVGATLVHISTDYVFDGKKTSPYTEEDLPLPINTYGISKLAGERFLYQCKNSYYIVRVASLFGAGGCRAKGGKNFVEVMLEKATGEREISVAFNIFCSPTYTKDAAVRIKKIIEKGLPSGVYHVVNDGYCSWFEFAQTIFEQAKLKVNLKKIEVSLEDNGFLRPRFTPLTSVKLSPLRPWRDALKDYLEERRKRV